MAGKMTGGGDGHVAHSGPVFLRAPQSGRRTARGREARCTTNLEFFDALLEEFVIHEKRGPLRVAHLHHLCGTSGGEHQETKSARSIDWESHQERGRLRRRRRWEKKAGVGLLLPVCPKLSRGHVIRECSLNRRSLALVKRFEKRCEVWRRRGVGEYGRAGQGRRCAPATSSCRTSSRTQYKSRGGSRNVLEKSGGIFPTSQNP